MKRRHLAITSFVILILIIATAGAWFYMQARNNGSEGDVDAVMDSVSQHILLPNGEKPALATVTDNTKIETDFLRNAENGDKLLVYEKAKTAILYRPSIDKLIAVGPVTIESLTDAQ